MNKKVLILLLLLLTTLSTAHQRTTAIDWSSSVDWTGIEIFNLRDLQNPYTPPLQPQPTELIVPVITVYRDPMVMVRRSHSRFCSFKKRCCVVIIILFIGGVTYIVERAL